MQYTAVLDALLGHGFSTEQAESALRALPLGGASVPAALDWLCLNLPPSQLPRRFAAGGARAAVGGVGAGVRVLAKGGTGPKGQSAQSSAYYDPCPELGSASEEEEDEEEESEDEEGGAPKAAPKPSAEDDAAAAKAWIRQRMAAAAAAQEEAEEGEEGEGSSEDSDIEDWELWADPREVARRRAVST